MTEVLDVRAVQTGSWWTVSVPGMPGIIAQVSGLEPRQLAATLAASTSTEDVVEISVRRVQQVAAGTGAPQARVDHRDAPPTWAEQAVRATRLSPSRVAALLQD